MIKKRLIFLILFSMFMLTINTQVSHAAIGEYSIVCGTTAKGQDMMCDMSTHKCVKCKTRLNRGLASLVAQHVQYDFKCINKDISPGPDCSVSNAGGRSGSSSTRILAFTIAENEGNECVTNNFLAMYTSTCYSCEIVETLSSAFIRAAAKAYGVTREAANAILVVGMILWIAIYVLKNITSFTTVEPRQMVQGFLVQFFKIFIAFTVINSGIPTILHYTMEPLMIAGTDFADAILMYSAPTGGL